LNVVSKKPPAIHLFFTCSSSGLKLPNRCLNPIFSHLMKLRIKSGMRSATFAKKYLSGTPDSVPLNIKQNFIENVSNFYRPTHRKPVTFSSRESSGPWPDIKALYGPESKRYRGGDTRFRPGIIRSRPESFVPKWGPSPLAPWNLCIFRFCLNLSVLPIEYGIQFFVGHIEDHPMGSQLLFLEKAGQAVVYGGESSSFVKITFVFQDSLA
jgi:hypothetical protein